MPIYKNSFKKLTNRKKKFNNEFRLILDLKDLDIYYEAYFKGLIKGIEFADKNPKWHKFPDEKPPKPIGFYSKSYVVASTKITNHIRELEWNGKSFGYNQSFCIEGVDWKNCDDEVIAWMELKFPNDYVDSER